MISEDVKCEKCNVGNDSRIAVSYNNLECVHCYNNNNSLLNPDNVTGKCPICEMGFMPYLDKNSRPMRESCIPCTIDSEEIFSTCRNCRYGDCYNADPNELINLNQSSLVGSFQDKTKKILNHYIKNNILEATYFCKKGNRKECNHLGNMCVLQNYEIVSESNNACNRLQNIIRENIYSWNKYVPSIFNENSDTSIELNRENSIQNTYHFGKEITINGTTIPDKNFRIIANIYTINGTFIDQKFIHSIDIQLCAGMYNNINGFLTFGKQYSYKCLLKNEDFKLKKSNLFYEIYLIWESYSSKQSYLYPIFIVNRSIQKNSLIKFDDDYINDNWILTKRFYTYEDTLFTNASNDIYFRYMDNFKLIIPIQKDKNGRIWPPYAIISYKEISNINETNNYEHAFTVLFTQKEPDNDNSIDILLAILCTISILWAAIKAYSWSKRSGKVIADISTIIQLLLCECDNVANIFIIIITISSVWCTFFYKGQKETLLILPLDENIYHYKNYISIALVLKSIAVIKKYSELILADTFFIDWEKSKGDSNEKPVEENNITNDILLNSRININDHQNIKNIKKLTQRQIGIWRTYLVANEWNELQNYRKTNIALQLFVTILVFEVLNFKNLSIVEPNFILSKKLIEINYYMGFFRFAIITIIYFLVLLIQWTVSVIILEPLIDPFHNFIDLCSIANISVLSLTTSLHGYYIHGQSPHGYADTNMQEINKFLQLEKNNQCGFRGLESGNDLQTYIITMPRVFRDKFLKIQGLLRQSTSRQIMIKNNKTETEHIEYRSKVYDELNIFLRRVIEHDDMECDYDILNMKAMEDIFDMEFADTTNRGVFYKDTSEIAFTQSFIYGNEWVFCTFEFCLLQFLDIFFNNLILASFLTFIVTEVIKKVASILFTSHLVKSSLIDSRFLI
uniref:Meckelin n=1 Tax=Strongyloides papillosus TaxID=174720 RepID=A0A0N5CGY7_STREA